MRICITGSPKAGKTSLAELLGKVFAHPVRHTDEVSHLDWSDASHAVAQWFNEPGPWIIEGVTIPRALRKWRFTLKTPEYPPPFEWLILMPEPRVFLSEQGQVTMKKQVVGLAETMKDWIGERWIVV